MVDVQAQKVLQVRLSKGVRGSSGSGAQRPHSSWLFAHSPASTRGNQTRGRGEQRRFLYSYSSVFIAYYGPSTVLVS